MELDVADRMKLLNILPGEGDYTTLKIVRELREELSFSEDEHEMLGFEKQYACPRCYNEEWSPSLIDCPVCKMTMRETGFTQWKTTDLVKEIPIGEKAAGVIADALKLMNEQKRLSESYMGLYEEFVEKETIR